MVGARQLWPLLALILGLALAGCAKKAGVCDHTREGERCQESGRDPQFSCVAGQCVDTSLIRKVTSGVPRAVLHELQSGKATADAYALGKKKLLASDLKRRYRSAVLVDKLWTSRILPALQRGCREEIQRLLQQGEVSTAAALYQAAVGPVVIEPFSGIKVKAASARPAGLQRFSLGKDGARRLFHHVLQHAAHHFRKGRHRAAFHLIHQVSTGVEPVDTWEKVDLTTRKELLDQVFSAGALVARLTGAGEPTAADRALLLALRRGLDKAGYWLVIDSNAPGSPRTLTVKRGKGDVTVTLLDAAGKQLFSMSGKAGPKGLAAATLKKLTGALATAGAWKSSR